MHTKQHDVQSGERCWRMVGWLAPALLLLGLSACEPEIANDPVPETMEFDSDRGRIPTPNIIAVNPVTNRIDLSLLGIAVPEDCLAQSELHVAECEFYQYLERLDGFPTMSGLSAPASRPLELASLTTAGQETDNLVVLNTGRMRKVTDLDVTLAEDGYVSISNPSGWEVDRLYVVAVRGYDNGVVTQDGTRVVASVIYNLLKREESLLSCHPDPHDPTELDDPVVDPNCMYHELLMEMYAGGYDDAAALEQAVFDMLVSLETLRQGFLGASELENVWSILELAGFMPKDEVAITWAFPTHRASVAELNPETGLVPEVTGHTGVRIPVKGSIDPTTLIASSGYAEPYLAGATAIVMDLTVLQTCQSPAECFTGFPSFDATHLDGAIDMSFDASPLQDGHQYAVVLVTSEDPARPGLQNGDGLPMVPSPVTVAVRARGPVLVDGHSVISSFDDDQAASLEDARLQLAELLDPAGFLMGAGVLTRENIAYVYVMDHGPP